MSGEKAVFIPRGGADFRRWLREIESRYAAAFEELGQGALASFKHMIDCVDALLDLLSDPKTDFRVKLFDYAKVRSDVFEFCRYYAKWLGQPLMERLKAEIYELMEEAISWWHEQDLMEVLER